MKRHFMKSSDIRNKREEAIERLGEELGTSLFPKKADVEKVEISNEELAYIVNGRFQLIQIKDDFIPSLFAVYAKAVKLPMICVDEGAIPYVLKGADVMVPGITETDEFVRGEVVAVSDETKTKPLAVGIALMNSDEISNTNQGKAIKSCHYLKDQYFEIARKVT